MPKISIVLPVYNGEEFLKESIDSVLSQSFRDFELIIVNDCSTDDSGIIAQKYAQSDDRVSYIKNLKNKKLPASLNVGFLRATGRYLTWTSADNCYQPNALETLLFEIESNSSIGLVYSDMEIIDGQSRMVGCLSAGLADHLIYRNVVGACFLYSAKLAKQVGLYNEEMFLCEDYEYWLRMGLISEFLPIHKVLYKYRKHQGALSSNREKEIISKGIALQKKYFSMYVKTRKQAAIFYAHLRGRDIYNNNRHFNLLRVLFYSPSIFFKEFFSLLSRRLDSLRAIRHEK